MEDYAYKIAGNFEIESFDYSYIKNVSVKNGTLFLKIDGFYLWEIGEKAPRYPVKEDCLLVLEHFTVTDEQAYAELQGAERLKEMEEYAASLGIRLHLPFEEFLGSTNVEVQGFDIHWDNRSITIDGYDGSQRAAIWVGMTFQFDRITAYWKKELDGSNSWLFGTARTISGEESE